MQIVSTTHKLLCFTSKRNVGTIATSFRTRLKPNVQLLTQRQRPSKVHCHYRDKLNNLLKELEIHNIMKQTGSSPGDNPNYGTISLNPSKIMPKGDSIECVLDERYLNSNTEQSHNSSLRYMSRTSGK